MISHQTIVHAIKNQLTTNNSPLLIGLADKSDEEICRLLFLNYRKNGEGAKGLRLANAGLPIMKACFESWDIRLPAEFRINMTHLIFLERNLTLPYHFTHEYLCIFEAEWAMRLKLISGDLNLLISQVKDRQNLARGE